MNNGFNGFSATEAPQSFTDRMVALAKDVTPAYLQARAQQRLLTMQLRRAEQGLPPLDPGSIAPTVRVGADPALLKTLREGVKSIAIPVAIGVAALILFRVMKKRRGG